MDEINNTNTPEATDAQEEKTYTQAEVDALLQAEADRRVTGATKKKEKEIAALKKQLENQKSLSQLDEEHRAEAEREMELNELKEKLATYEAEKNRAENMKVFIKRGMPAEMAEYVNLDMDPEDAIEVIDGFHKVWKASLEQARKEVLANTSNIPQLAEAVSGKLTKEQFNKMSLAEQQALYNSEPELVRSLIG